MELFSFFPQIFIVVAVAFVVVFLAWKFPKTKKKHELEKRAEAIAHKTKESKQKFSDIRMSNTHKEPVKKMKVEEVETERPVRRTRKIKTNAEEAVGVVVSKRKKERTQKIQKEEFVDSTDTLKTPDIHEEREKALEDKKEMHQNVLKVIDRVAYLAKRGGSLVKTGAVATVAFARKQQAALKRRKMTPQEVDQEKLVDVFENAGRALGAADYSTAESRYIDAIKIDPRNTRAYKGLVDVYEKQGNIDHAIASVEQVSKLDPSDPFSEKKLVELSALRTQKKMEAKKIIPKKKGKK